MRRRRTPIKWSSTSPDEELVGWAQYGEREAFGVLYDRHFNGVYGYCYRRLGEREAAQDAAAETFRKALVALPSYRPQAFRGWLFAIARHVVTDTFRARHSDLSLDDAVDIADAGRSMEETVLTHAELDFIVTLLSRLTPEQHDVIDLRLAGLTPAEIGVALGKSRSAVDMTLHRALRRLRELTTVSSGVAGGDNRG